VVILLSKYFSKANENKKREKIEINIEGIKVNNEKNIIYFLFAIEPFTFILFLIEFLASLKIIKKNNNNKNILANNKFFKLLLFSSKKLLSINVKNVTNPTIRVNKNIIIINRFLFMKVNINYKYIKK
tara:strand:- start:1138 stop:1521 length:384 start_codon:yes stop_codon:yes gene_type:complete